MTVEAPGQVPTLPSHKSGPYYDQTELQTCFIFIKPVFQNLVDRMLYLFTELHFIICFEIPKPVCKNIFEPFREKASVLNDFVAAGVETTALAAIFVLYALAANPEKQEKLRKKIQNHFEHQEIGGKVW